MQFKIYFGFLFLAAVFLTACHSASMPEKTHFGGHIKNPKSDEVFILKNDVKIAMTKLDNKHRFSFDLDSITEGLYTFKHGEEFQYVYLEPKDSLLIRLNTWDFDESLVFSGKGAVRNNFLIQLFLSNEKQEKLFNRYYNLEEKLFTKKTDSLLVQKNILINQFKNGNIKQTSKFESLIETAIILPIYTNKEKYAPHFQHLNQLNKLPELSSEFYAHRKKAITGKLNFNNYYTYSNYYWNYIYNMSLHKKELDTLNSLSTILIKQIALHIKDENLKNTMLQKTFTNILFDDSCNKNDFNLTKELFYKNCSDSICKTDITSLLKSYNSLKKGTLIPQFSLKDNHNSTTEIRQLINQKTVVYFWPKEKNRIKNMSKRIGYLIKKYPNYQFIGIDTQLEYSTWKLNISCNKLSDKNQYQLRNLNDKSFFNNDIPRALILDKNGIIQHDFTFLSHPDFERKL